MHRESVSEAINIIENYFTVGKKKLNIDEMLSWHKECQNDGGERSWWLTPALLQIFSWVARRNPEFHKDGIDEWFEPIDYAVNLGKVTISKAQGVAPAGCNTGRVYVYGSKDIEKLPLVWHGPLQTPTTSLADWPYGLISYRDKIDFGYVGDNNTVCSWYTQAMICTTANIMHARGFYPSSDLSGNSPYDGKKIIDFIQPYLNSMF